MKEVVLIDGVRTPFGKFGGSLSEFDPYDLSAIVMKEIVERNGIDKNTVDEIFWGVGDTSQCKDVYTPVVARQGLLKAGFPPETVSLNLDTACCSSMTALQLAFRAIKAGEIDTAITGGVNVFSKVPYVVRGLRFRGKKLGHIQLEDPLFELGYKDYNPVAVDTGEVALEYGVTREQQDLWAYRSHQRYGKAWKAGKFKREIMVLEVPIVDERGRLRGKRELNIDEQYRPDTSYETLSKLPTIYGSPTVTAGNAPGLNDGAAALLVMNKEKAEEMGLKWIAEVVDVVRVADKPRYLARVPAFAILKILDRNQIKLDDVRRIEINEAFAAQPLVSTKLIVKKHYNSNDRKLEEIRDKTNVNGGAIAIGHPNPASGARITMTLAYELNRIGGGLGIASICGGLAQGDAALLKV